jgi:hypothetical protein
MRVEHGARIPRVEVQEQDSLNKRDATLIGIKVWPQGED